MKGINNVFRKKRLLKIVDLLNADLFQKCEQNLFLLKFNKSKEHKDCLELKSNFLHNKYQQSMIGKMIN